MSAEKAVGEFDSDRWLTLEFGRGASRARGVGRSFPATLPLAEIVAGLNRFDPTDRFAYPSMMHRLAGEMTSGRLSLSPWALSCGAGPLLAKARAEIEPAFGRPVMNRYAAAEVGVIARSYRADAIPRPATARQEWPRGR